MNFEKLRLFIPIFGIVVVTSFGPASRTGRAATAGTPAQKLFETPILLFGQKCIIQGPMDESKLKSVHSISPEQIPVIETIEQAKQASTQLMANFNKITDKRI